MIVYKNNYEGDERLFSTGDSNLDDILEEVYYSGVSDGYDYAQYEFSDKKKKEKSNFDLDERMLQKLRNASLKHSKGDKTEEERERDEEDFVNNFNNGSQHFVSRETRRSINQALDRDKLLTGKMSEKEYLEKYPRAKRGSKTLERSLITAGLGTTAASLGVGIPVWSKLMDKGKDKAANNAGKALLAGAALGTGAYLAGGGINMIKERKDLKKWGPKKKED